MTIWQLFDSLITVGVVSPENTLREVRDRVDILQVYPHFKEQLRDWLRAIERSCDMDRTTAEDVANAQVYGKDGKLGTLLGGY